MTLLSHPANQAMRRPRTRVLKVPLTSLPNTKTFKEAIAAYGDPAAGNSTLLPALDGAVAFAKRNPKSVIVFVTDGLLDLTQPGPCGERYADLQTHAKQAATSGIKTYVLGVGDPANREAFDRVANAGGTGQALWLNVKDPHETEKKLLTALIKDSGLCPSMSIPSVPNGQTYDYNAFEVTITPAQGQPTKIPYNASCQGGTGWHYDNAQAPKKVMLCETTCSPSTVIKVASACFD